MKLLFKVIIFLITIQVFSQDQVKIDSLEKLLRKTKDDTVKVDFLKQLFREYIKSDTLRAIDIADQWNIIMKH